MQIIFDIGNTYIKYALFDGRKLQSKGILDSSIEVFLKDYEHQNHSIIISSVRADETYHFPNFKKVLILDHTTSLPIKIDYETPHTLGKDRIANAVGAYSLAPDQNQLIIDCGTCINYEWINKNTFEGGLISPGIDMRLKAMHHFTGKLPLTDRPIFNETDNFSKPITGKNTIENIQLGAFHGVIGEISHQIEQYKLHKNVESIILTGGDAKYFEKHINYNIFVNENLTLIGLNEILLYQKY